MIMMEWVTAYIGRRKCSMFAVKDSFHQAREVFILAYCSLPGLCGACATFLSAKVPIR
ncbi:hypothetical protein BDW68DRAFT_157308 [Aspergillus falconensis]